MRSSFEKFNDDKSSSDGIQSFDNTYEPPSSLRYIKETIQEIFIDSRCEKAAHFSKNFSKVDQNFSTKKWMNWTIEWIKFSELNVFSSVAHSYQFNCREPSRRLVRGKPVIACFVHVST